MTFHANNTCEFIMAGINTPGLTQGLQEVAMDLTKAEAFVINYYGVNYNCSQPQPALTWTSMAP